MNTTQKIDRFIADKRSELGRSRDAVPLAPGTLPFVTIARQSGAGGHLLAETLLELLGAEDDTREGLTGWRIFDRSMCQHVLENNHLAEAMNELLDEEYHSQIAEFVLGVFGGERGMQNAAYVRLSRMLRAVALVGKVVIVGYGGVMATRELGGGTDVRLVAPLPIRAARVAAARGIDPAEAARLLQRRDAEQQNLLKAHYHVDGTDPELYDLVCNTDRISVRSVAELLVTRIRKQVS